MLDAAAAAAANKPQSGWAHAVATNGPTHNNFTRNQAPQRNSHFSRSKKVAQPTPSTTNAPLTNGVAVEGKTSLTPEKDELQDKKEMPLSNTETPATMTNTGSGQTEGKEITPPDGILPLDSPNSGGRPGRGREDAGWVSVQRRKKITKGDGKVCVCVCVCVCSFE